MPPDQFYWLCSTIAQTIGALVGVVGMAIIYKYQTIGNLERFIMDESSRLRTKIFGVDRAYGQTASEFLKQLILKVDDSLKPDNMYYTSAKHFKERLIKLRNSRRWLLGMSIPFISAGCITIFLSTYYICRPDLFDKNLINNMLILTIIILILLALLWIRLTAFEN